MKREGGASLARETKKREGRRGADARVDVGVLEADDDRGQADADRGDRGDGPRRRGLERDGRLAGRGAGVRGGPPTGGGVLEAEDDAPLGAVDAADAALLEPLAAVRRLAEEHPPLLAREGPLVRERRGRRPQRRRRRRRRRVVEGPREGMGREAPREGAPARAAARDLRGVARRGGASERRAATRCLCERSERGDRVPAGRGALPGPRPVVVVVVAPARREGVPERAGPRAEAPRDDGRGGSVFSGAGSVDEGAVAGRVAAEGDDGARRPQGEGEGRRDAGDEALGDRDLDGLARPPREPRVPEPGREKRETLANCFKTSVVFRSFRLMFGRATISRGRTESVPCFSLGRCFESTHVEATSNHPFPALAGTRSRRRRRGGSARRLGASSRPSGARPGGRRRGPAPPRRKRGTSTPRSGRRRARRRRRCRRRRRRPGPRRFRVRFRRLRGAPRPRPPRPRRAPRPGRPTAAGGR